MFDLIKTLDPVHGLTRGWQMRPPTAGQPMWSVAVDIGGLAARGASAGDYPLHLVGAYGTSRTDTMARAAGEAVERFALIPGEQGPRAITATAASLGAAALDHVAAGLGAPVTAPMRWYEGTWLHSGAPVWVPAGLVDYPVDTTSFDPSPSGAAAGPDFEFAVRGALLELVERDAMGVAWAAGAFASEIDLGAELAAAPRTGEWRRLATLHSKGLPVRLVRVPVLPGLHCVLSTVVDGTMAACGAKAHEEWDRALLIALQESLQVHEMLTVLRDQWGAVEAPEVVRDDIDRARLWLTAGAVGELERRLVGLPREPPGSASFARRSVTDLVEAVRADGGEPLVVDLSRRLPEAHRAMGWHAVKVVVPGYQPLRMDERHPFGWRQDRIEAAGPLSRFPHPLI
ncbi:YcaO-like family protein [Lentzea sp. JNUCC 0626]|uniref:YcaO-like family protein n=1 Tax=Lentzea sp. JNUCC 0626 TaxID=3367513 RepID=UPI0037488CD1